MDAAIEYAANITGIFLALLVAARVYVLSRLHGEPKCMRWWFVITIAVGVVLVMLFILLLACDSAEVNPQIITVIIIALLFFVSALIYLFMINDAEKRSGDRQ
jgi:ABC-type Fe3+-siderophore transport system permease subunit